MFYTHHQLDRADHLRKDDAAIAEHFSSQDAMILLAWRGKQLVGEDDKAQPRMVAVPSTANGINDIANAQRLFLGFVRQKPLFAMSISDAEESALEMWISDASNSQPHMKNIRFEDLRALGPNLPLDEGALLAYARGLTYWHDTCLFCSRCGNELHSTHAGHIKQCSNADCDYQSFPRTDSAVIMLVTRPITDNSPALCLLGRSHAWPPGVYSTLAGFVETGESLEQAVQREVFEEANITTNDVRYIASQPWPFPRSIMLGFEATATSTDITCDPNEIEDAQWFSAEQLKQFGTWGDENSELKLPRPDSIARYLVNRWISENE